jgi:alpha-ketoglutaric semialdehyde dehydrogenase
MGPAVNEKQLQTDLSYVEIGKNEGAKLTVWRQSPRPRRLSIRLVHGADRIYRRRPEDAHRAGRNLRPVVSIIPCDDLEDAIEIANGIEYGLSSALYTKDVNKAFAAIRDLYAGITYINAPTIGAEVHLPFGGTKATGNGHREGGIGAIDFYTEWKSVYVDYSDKLQKAQIDRAD